jgi:SAM-dependent methyltransferase
MTTLDYAAVSRYWGKATSSILGPYVMDGFGLPASAGRFRFDAECKIFDQLICSISSGGCVLDLGCGNGLWTEHFAQRFSRVVGVEASKSLFEALEERCTPYSNVTLVHGDVMLFEPEDHYDVIFLGGLLMYLNEEDVTSLLEKLIPFLRSGGIVLCRETTVRQGTTTRQGDYQAVYRSVADYERIFAECELSVLNSRMNTPYVLLQMGCEFVKKWKTLIPAPFQCIPVVGHLAYWKLRLGYPWITRIPTALGLSYPELTNYFFVLQPDSLPTYNSAMVDNTTCDKAAAKYSLEPHFENVGVRTTAKYGL